MDRPLIHPVKETPRADPVEKIEIVIGLLSEIYSRLSKPKMVIFCEDKDAVLRVEEEAEEAVLLHWFSATSLVLLGRLLQSSLLRPLAQQVLLRLPRVPASCLRLLRLLLHTGSRSGGAVGNNPTSYLNSSAVKNRRGRSVRAEAADIVLKLSLRSCDEETRRESLFILLWSAVCDDFETRSKTIASLMSEVVGWRSVEASLLQTVFLFALQAAVTAASPESVG